MSPEAPPSPERRAVPLQEVYDFLNRCCLSDSLIIIGSINAAFRYGFKTLATEGIPENIVRWLTDLFPDEISRVQLAVNMNRAVRLLLLSGANDYKRVILDTGSRELTTLYNLLSDLHDPVDNIESAADIPRIMSRLAQSQFPMQDIRANLVARGHLLFRALPKQLHCSYDMDRAMLEATGLTVYEFMTIGLTLTAISGGVLKHNMTVEVEALKNVVTRAKILKFVELSSGTNQDYKRRVRGDKLFISNPLADLYSTEPLMQMPFIKTEQSMIGEPGCWAVPQAAHLWRRLSTGIFYILSDFEQERARMEGHAQRNPFRDAFGDIFKAYVSANLQSQKETLIDLDTIEYADSKPDFALLLGNSAVLFEVKTSISTAMSRCLADETRLAEEIRNGQFSRGLTQLNTFSEAVLNGGVADKRFASIKRIVKVIVALEDFYVANSLLLPIAAKELGTEAIKDVQIASVTDIEGLGQLVANKGEVVELLLAKVADPNTVPWNIKQFIHNKYPKLPSRNPVLDSAFEEFFSEMSGQTPEELRHKLLRETGR